MKKMVCFAVLALLATAIAEYDRAVRIEPGFALACYMRGIAKAMLGRTEGASAHMKHALALAAGNADLVAHMERELRKLERAQGRTGVCCSSILTPAGWAQARAHAPSVCGGRARVRGGPGAARCKVLRDLEG